MSKYKILQTKDKLLLAKCNKIQANNGVQILPGSDFYFNENF